MELPESAYSNADGGADEQLEEGGDLTLGVVVADGGGVHGADGGGEADSDAYAIGGWANAYPRSLS